ncbi:SERTA domain-containing protein 1 [Python bivittatus]|uniref:SERTA domain-containing protein 1 n=1 Tax=Python bivittatus TaxID=176946 RepID=A0A9F5J6Q0_PYTBI|nr:SERTA domain-containing protein 1 [Python bivittatus]XP_025026011.1 SERTA domain-containing protein 1 [Python bivittatus]
MKRKWSEEEAGPAAATPCSSLFSLSVSKLHQSLQHVEPNLRHLVLVANTLRRCQGEMQPVPAPVLQATLGQEGPCPGGSSISMPSVLACRLSEPSWRLPSLPSLSPHVDERLLSTADSSAFPTFLEDSNDIAQPEGPHLCLLSPEAERPSHPCPSSTLELLSPAGYLLEDGLEGVFEDIDTSMYDCDLWLPTSLPNFKEAFCSPGEQRPDLADLDCLMDMLVGVQEL